MTQTQNLASAGIADQYAQFETSDVMTWCGGCGNYAIQNALKRALALEGIGRDNVIFCFDVGCSGNGSDKMEGYTVHGLHGRVLPLAAGVKIAQHNTHIICEAGDGATFSEGAGHVIHAVRNDYPVLFIHHDNQNYGLTTGQCSSLTPKGCKMNAAPEGNPIEPLNPLEIVLSLKPSFVARTCCVDVEHMTEIFRQALNHKGFAFIETLQSCPTYNKHTTHEWYVENIKFIEKEFPDYDPADIWQAKKLVAEEVPYLGLIYHNPKRESFLEALVQRDENDPMLIDEVHQVDVSPFMTHL